MTTEYKHTPGPWFVQGSIITPTKSGKRFAIAEVFRDSVATAEANAQLIAAAPDLLATLQEIADSAAFIGSNVTPSMIERIARAAIAKATGKGAA